MIRLPPLTEPVKQTFAMSVFWISAGHVLVLAGDDVEHAGRQLLGDALHDAGRRQRRRGRRLDDRGVAGQQRVRQRRAEDRDRPVERHDHRDHAERLVRHDRSRPGCRARPGSVLPVSTSSAMHQGEVPADLEHERVDPATRSGSCRSPATGSRHPRRGRRRCRRSPRAICAARSVALSADHAGNAAFAAATASATSSFDADAAWPTIDARLCRGRRSRASRSVWRASPPMNRPVRTVSNVSVMTIKHLSVS